MTDSAHEPDDVAAQFNALMSIEKIALLFDASPSMLSDDYFPTRLEAAKKAALAFVDKKIGLDERDEIAIVSFSGKVRVHSGPQPVGDNRAEFEKKINKIKVSYWDGGTAIGEALGQAATILGLHIDYPSSITASRNRYTYRIVLLSDGENNRGKNPFDVANKLKSTGVTIDTVGIGQESIGSKKDGTGLNEEALKEIASPDRYRYVEDSSNLAKHYNSLAEKLIPDMSLISYPPEKPVFEPPYSGLFSRIHHRVSAFAFSIRHIRKVKPGSAHIGKFCLNENNEETQFKVGDVIVICPVHEHHLHHIDCWIMNGCKCYGRGVKCTGTGQVPPNYYTSLSR